MFDLVHFYIYVTHSSKLCTYVTLLSDGQDALRKTAILDAHTKGKS